LLANVLAETDIQRVRVSSLEPGDFNESWLSLWQSPRMCRHLHLPLQAGSRTVLQRMERRYSPEDFELMVLSCRRFVPDVTITTDVMVGFPGESDAEFDEGYQFILSMRFDGMHVFKYSRRSGTRARGMPNQISDERKSERSVLLRAEAAAGVARLVSRHAGAIATVVWETEREGAWRGLTDTGVRVYSPGPIREGSMSAVRLGSGFRDGLWALPLYQEISLTAR
jgi:threonylcarbamoyladenosine tRNA methylthiotransferase MtaB